MDINLTLIAQALTFAAFIAFTVKFVWPYLLRAIEERQKTIADGLAAAEQGKASLETSTRQAAELVTQGRDRASEVIAQAEKRSAQMVEEARVRAKEEGNREKAAAQAEIEQQVARAREALREQVAALAVAGAEKILRREVDARAHADLLAQLRQELR
ncbi:MAG: F0F1 ATP synthase subunit B [Burkholderiales bacterium]